MERKMRRDLDVNMDGMEEKKGKIKVKDLLEILDILKPGLSSGGLQEEADHYLFMGDKVATFNGSICVVADFSIGFEGSVKALEFYKLLSGVAEKKLEIRLEKGQLMAGKKKSSFGLSYCEPGKSHEIVKSLYKKDLNWRPLNEEVKRAIGLCAFSSSKDMTKPALAGVFVGGGDVMSSDNYRISWFQFEEGGIKRSFLIPAQAAAYLIQYDLKEYALEESWVHFRGNEVYYGSRLLDNEFPQKAKEFFPEKDLEGFEVPEALSAALDKAMILLQEDPLLDKEVNLSFRRDSILCESNKKGVGWVEEEVPLKGGPEEDIKLSVNPVFLKEILKYTTQVIPVDENRLMFLSGNFRHLIALGM